MCRSLCVPFYTHLFLLKEKKTARAEAFQPGHLTWRALASRCHCTPLLAACTRASDSILDTGVQQICMYCIVLYVVCSAVAMLNVLQVQGCVNC